MSLKLDPELVSRKQQSGLGWNSILPNLLSLMDTMLTVAMTMMITMAMKEVVVDQTKLMMVYVIW